MPIDRSPDRDDLFSILLESHRQVDQAREIEIRNRDKLPIDYPGIIYSGLGGSAISADLALNMLREEIKVPLQINRNYGLPLWLDSRWPVILTSYSGNTAETLSALEIARKRGCSVVCVTSGGKLLRIAEKDSLPLIQLPAGYQPRYALYLMMVALLRLLRAMEAIPDQEKTIDSIHELLVIRGEEYSRNGNGTLDAARKIHGSIPVIYSAAGYTNGVGMRFKSQLNENSKVHAFHNIIPEMNHNEITGWQYVDGKNDPFSCISIIDREYPEPIRARFSVTRELLAGQNVPVIELTSDRSDLPGRIIDLVYTCDWVSYYLALLNGRDPGNIDFIEAVKKGI